MHDMAAPTAIAMGADATLGDAIFAVDPAPDAASQLDRAQALAANVETWLTLQEDCTRSLMATLSAQLSDLEESLQTPAAVDADASLVASPRPSGTTSSCVPYAAAAATTGPSTPPANCAIRSVGPTACVSSAAKEFPAIETVLAARQRRALLQNAASGATTEARSPPVPLALSACDSLLSPPRPRRAPPTPLVCSGGSDIGLSPPAAALRRLLVRPALAEWREARPPTFDGAVASLLLDRAAAVAPALALRAAHRSLVASCRASRQRGARRAQGRLLALGASWRQFLLCWRDAVGWDERRLTARQHACVRSLQHAVARWLWRTARARAQTLASTRVTETTRRLERARVVRLWRRWMQRRAAWERRLTRRAAAQGGWARLHLPCMRRFEPRAVFVEEGSAAMADAYRRRRMAAIALCTWLHVASAGSAGRSREHAPAAPMPAPTQEDMQEEEPCEIDLR